LYYNFGLNNQNIRNAVGANNYRVLPYGGIKGEYSMKNWKHCTLVAIITFFVIIIGFIACDENNGKIDPCNCDPKAHLGIGENCNCGLKDCICTEQTAWLGGIVDGVKIRKEIGISVAQMEAALENIEKAFESDVLDGHRPALMQKVTEIHIVSGNTISKLDTIMGIGLDTPEGTIRSAFYGISVSKIYQLKEIWLAMLQEKTFCQLKIYWNNDVWTYGT
jgi:hypothetical protein